MSDSLLTLNGQQYHLEKIRDVAGSAPKVTIALSEVALEGQAVSYEGMDALKNIEDWLDGEPIFYKFEGKFLLLRGYRKVDAQRPAQITGKLVGSPALKKARVLSANVQYVAPVAQAREIPPEPVRTPRYKEQFVEPTEPYPEDDEFSEEYEKPAPREPAYRIERTPAPAPSWNNRPTTGRRVSPVERRWHELLAERFTMLGKQASSQDQLDLQYEVIGEFQRQFHQEQRSAERGTYSTPGDQQRARGPYQRNTPRR